MRLCVRIQEPYVGAARIISAKGCLLMARVGCSRKERTSEDRGTDIFYQLVDVSFTIRQRLVFPADGSRRNTGPHERMKKMPGRGRTTDVTYGVIGFHDWQADAFNLSPERPLQ